MSFGLKYVGATYKHLMNKVFESQIGRTVEVYMGDMVVKFNNLLTISRIWRVIQTTTTVQYEAKPREICLWHRKGKFFGLDANP